LHQQSAFVRLFASCLGLFILTGLTLRAGAEPSRIVTLSPACAEVVAGLGWGDRIVGVSDYTDYPASASKLPSVGSYVNPSLETIVSLRPDLVVATSDGNPPALLDRLRSMGIEVFVLDLRWMKSVGRSIVELGARHGRKERAEEMVAEVDRVSRCIARELEGAKRPRVLFAFDLDPAIAPGLDGFANELVRLAGGDSVTEGISTPYPRLTVEQIIAIAPEVIVASTMDPAVQLESWQKWLGGWKAIPAIRDGRLHLVDGSNLDRPSQRVIIGVRKLADVLHPGRLASDACIPRRSLID
jgi:iron complex transport system substrate-binding protein